MAKPARFEHNRFLGDKRNLVVHDLNGPHDECAVNELVASERFLTFGPDTLAEARNRGYKPCKRGCIALPVQQEPYEVDA